MLSLPVLNTPEKEYEFQLVKKHRQNEEIAVKKFLQVVRLNSDCLPLHFLDSGFRLEMVLVETTDGQAGKLSIYYHSSSRAWPTAV